MLSDFLTNHFLPESPKFTSTDYLADHVLNDFLPNHVLPDFLPMMC